MLWIFLRSFCINTADSCVWLVRISSCQFQYARLKFSMASWSIKTYVIINNITLLKKSRYKNNLQLITQGSFIPFALRLGVPIFIHAWMEVTLGLIWLTWCSKPKGKRPRFSLLKATHNRSPWTGPRITPYNFPSSISHAEDRLPIRLEWLGAGDWHFLHQYGQSSWEGRKLPGQG